MRLWEENGQVTSLFDYFLNKGLLFLKVRLKLKYAFAATCFWVRITLLSLSMKILDIKSTLKEHIFDAFWLIRKIRMISRINHHLRNHCAIGQWLWCCGVGHKPTISQPLLFSTWVHIHLWGQQGIFWISRVAYESCQPLSVLGTQVHVPARRLGWSLHTTFLMPFSLWTQILLGESNLPALWTVPVTNQGIGLWWTDTKPPCYKGNKCRTHPFGFPTGLGPDRPQENHTVTV